MPKAQVSPNLTLSPVERMRIEYITRNPPKPEPKKSMEYIALVTRLQNLTWFAVFRERLLIYHGGLFRTNLLAIIKVWTMIVLFGFATVVVPAYYVYGSPWWVVGFRTYPDPLPRTFSLTAVPVSVAGLVPFVIVNVTQRPFVTWIHLHLPVQARLSPKAAMEYARNLPGNAVLHISFQRWTALGATVEANLADLVPAKGVWWRPVTFEWVGPSVDKGSLLRPNSTRFYVKPKTGTGKEARDTIPGIWELVYKNITGIDSNAVKRWRK